MLLKLRETQSRQARNTTLLSPFLSPYMFAPALPRSTRKQLHPTCLVATQAKGRALNVKLARAVPRDQAGGRVAVVGECRVGIVKPATRRRTARRKHLKDLVGCTRVGREIKARAWWGYGTNPIGCRPRQLTHKATPHAGPGSVR